MGNKGEKRTVGYGRNTYHVMHDAVMAVRIMHNRKTPHGKPGKTIETKTQVRQSNKNNNAPILISDRSKTKTFYGDGIFFMRFEKRIINGIYVNYDE